MVTAADQSQPTQALGPANTTNGYPQVGYNRSNFRLNRGGYNRGGQGNRQYGQGRGRGCYYQTNYQQQQGYYYCSDPNHYINDCPLKKEHDAQREAAVRRIANQNQPQASAGPSIGINAVTIVELPKAQPLAKGRLEPQVIPLVYPQHQSMLAVTRSQVVIGTTQLIPPPRVLKTTFVMKWLEQKQIWEDVIVMVQQAQKD